MRKIIFLTPLLCFYFGAIKAQVNPTEFTSDSLLKPEIINQMASVTKSSKDAGFIFFERNTKKIDSIMHIEGFSGRLVDTIIIREELNPLLDLHSQQNNYSPNWTLLARRLKKKYTEATVIRIIMNAKLNWYEQKQDWFFYCKYLIEKVIKYGPFEKRFPNNEFTEDWKYNVVAWDIFEHSSNKQQLLIAAKWSLKAINISDQVNIQYYDTYANILYKAGKVSEGIKWEEKALTLNPQDVYIKNNLDKMRKGLSTWPKLN